MSSVPVPTPIDPITLAGTLAEAGVQRLTLLYPGEPPRGLVTRETDLPGMLRAAPIGTILRTSLGDVAVTPRGLEFNPVSASL